MTRALTLCGPGGIGKTRLALRLLAELGDEFPDGVFFIELGDLRQPDLVVSRVASVIGVDEERGRPLLDTLADAIRPRRLLLGLDNCEHLIETCARVCERLVASSPGLRLIVTSREPLRVAAETVWQVPPLSFPPATATPRPGAAAGTTAVPGTVGGTAAGAGVTGNAGTAGGARTSAGPGIAAVPGTAGPGGTAGAAAGDPAHFEAVRLFADRAAAALPGFSVAPANAAAVAELCRALDGMPLAIELAAARVGVLSVAQIAARLTDRFGLLTSGGRTAPPRQRTLRATIDWSHELLTGAEQVLLRRLSVFVGWSLEMAEQVCSDDQLPPGDMLGLIAGLLDKSLVVIEPEVLGQARYRLLDTIREYAAARLAAAGETTKFRHRLREYTLAVAEHNHAVGMAQIAAPWSARVDVFLRYDVDGGNAWQVLSQCLAEGDAETGLRICTAVRPCWLVRGSFAEGGEWMDSFLAIDAPELPASVRGPALVGRAQLALSSDPAGAQAWAMHGLELCRAAGEQFWIASALNLLSEIALHTGRADEAAGYAQQAWSAAHAGGDGWNEGYALGTRATVAALRGRLREAQQLAGAAITVMDRIEQQWGVARTLLGLGDLARLRGDPVDARARYLAALPILRVIDARPEIARCLAGLGRVALDQGTTGLAREHLAESIRLSHSTGARIGVARGLEAFAALAVQEGTQDRAVLLAAAAAALREAAGLPPLPGARTQDILRSARSLGQQAIESLWAQGRAMTGDGAVTLALTTPPVPAAPGTDIGGNGRDGIHDSKAGRTTRGADAAQGAGPTITGRAGRVGRAGSHGAGNPGADGARRPGTGGSGTGRPGDGSTPGTGRPGDASTWETGRPGDGNAGGAWHHATEGAGEGAPGASGQHGGASAVTGGRSGAGAGGHAVVARAVAGGPAANLPGILTPREREIVALVAAGRSNGEIAKELFITQATAARHVANIFAKLGFTSRSQVAAWAAARRPDPVADGGDDAHEGR